LEDRLFGESLPSLPLTPDLRMDPKMGWLLGFNQARGWAREEKFDKALARLKQLEKDLSRVFSKKNGSLLINRYFALLMKAYGWIYSKQGRFSEAREAFSAGLARLQEDSDQDQIQGLRLRNYLAYLDMQEGRHQQAIRTFLRTAEQAEALGPQAKKLIGNNELGAAYLAAGEYRGAIACLEEDWNSLGPKGNGQLKMKIAYSLGGAYAKIENYREARRAYERVVELARGERNWDYLYRGLNGLGNVAKLQRRLEEALDYYKRSFCLAEYRGDFLSAAIVSQNRGAILGEMERLEEALRDLQLSRQLTNKAPHSFQTRWLLARTCQELGRIYQKKGDIEQAKIYYSEARNRSQEEGMKDFRLYPLLSLAELALCEGKWELFREYHAEAAHWADSPEKKQKLQELEARKAIHVKLEVETAIPSPGGANINREEALWNILEINHALLAEADSAYLLKKILRCSADLSGAETILLLGSREEGPWKILEFFGVGAGETQLDFARKMAHLTHASGQSLRATDALTEEPYRRDPAVHAQNLRSLACISVKIPEKLEIALYFSHRYKAGLFDEAKLRLMEAFADQVALALKNVPHPLAQQSPSLYQDNHTRLT
ncbi:MAG TPA: tetratricopeptide repeat protein, partial [bacterium]|nr:tetratricopeptide repeat protein [bacterium]